MRCFFQLVPGILFILGLAACHPRPIDDLALADVAIKAAQKVKADALAPDFFRKAENFYLRAKKDFTEGYYDSSKKFASQARMMAEKAEYRALQRQTQSKTKIMDEDTSGTSPDPFK
ncbi:MAG: DUF4398 domain-containing protein [Deltaproteobacteria bacterium]|nr:DUF4398 domain-containing protein [Deltaproteobacteria bacterium]MBM4316583.1 DUF4398 domain-containing protein [Deltaproteobacteria bacterium]